MKQNTLKLKGLIAAAFAAAGFVVFLVYYFFVSPSWCIHVPTARITMDDRPTAAQLYRKADGQLLVVFDNRIGFIYRIPPDRKTVYFSATHSLKFTSTGAWDKRIGVINPYGVDLGYVDGIKVASIKRDTDSTLVVRDKHIEFNGLEMERIIIDW